MVVVDTGGAQRHPGDTARLVKYWVSGPGAGLIKWNVPGDFNRCVTHVQAAIVKNGGKPLPDHEIKGFCANLHKLATGGSPGHGSAEQGMHGH